MEGLPSARQSGIIQVRSRPRCSLHGSGAAQSFPQGSPGITPGSRPAQPRPPYTDPPDLCARGTPPDRAPRSSLPSQARLGQAASPGDRDPVTDRQSTRGKQSRRSGSGHSRGRSPIRAPHRTASHPLTCTLPSGSSGADSPSSSAASSSSGCSRADRYQPRSARSGPAPRGGSAIAPRAPQPRL